MFGGSRSSFAHTLPLSIRTAEDIFRLPPMDQADEEAVMSTHPTYKRDGWAIADLFFSIFGPVVVAAIVLLLASALGIL